MQPMYEAHQAADKRPQTSRQRMKSSTFALTLAAALVLAACGDKKQEQHSAQGAPPPPEVSVLTVKLESIPVVSDLPGRLEPYRVAQVGARVAGILQKRAFKEGSDPPFPCGHHVRSDLDGVCRADRCRAFRAAQADHLTQAMTPGRTGRVRHPFASTTEDPTLLA